MNQLKFNKTIKIFNILEKKFGPQNWWPTTLKGELHPSYHGKKPNEKQRFEIIVGAILTQNTSWKNVEKAIFNLNKAKVLSIDKIKSIRKEKLAKLIRPAGYYNQKAERLKIAAKFFSKNKDPARDQLLAVKGIGPETADSILLYAFNCPVFVVDAYTKRIFSRVGLCKPDWSYSEFQDFFYQNLESMIYKQDAYNKAHALLVELAKQNCRKKPLCHSCPINKFCKKRI